MTLVVDMFVDLICGDIKVDVVILVVERCVVVILLDATSEDDDILFVFMLEFVMFVDIRLVVVRFVVLILLDVILVVKRLTVVEFVYDELVAEIDTKEDDPLISILPTVILFWTVTLFAT